jgi:hypothetical protein
MFKAFPLLAVSAAVYNFFGIALVASGKAATANDSLTRAAFTVPMPMNAQWPVSGGDLLIGFSLVLLFFELVRATHSDRVAIINHSLSMILFIICLVEFLLVPGFQTSTFFLISLMVLLDVLAGFIVTIVSSRKEIDVAS